MSSDYLTTDLSEHDEPYLPIVIRAGRRRVCELWQDDAPEPQYNSEQYEFAKLMVAAHNSYRKHCGPRAVECAEGDLLGELLEACKALLPFARECMPPVGHICGPESQCDASCMDAAAIAQIIHQANAAIAKAEGGAK